MCVPYVSLLISRVARATRAFSPLAQTLEALSLVQPLALESGRGVEPAPGLELLLALEVRPLMAPLTTTSM